LGGGGAWGSMKVKEQNSRMLHFQNFEYNLDTLDISFFLFLFKNVEKVLLSIFVSDICKVWRYLKFK
jgi:hypothetical protein